MAMPLPSRFSFGSPVPRTPALSPLFSCAPLPVHVHPIPGLHSPAVLLRSFSPPQAPSLKPATRPLEAAPMAARCPCHIASLRPFRLVIPMRSPTKPHDCQEQHVCLILNYLLTGKQHKHTNFMEQRGTCTLYEAIKS